MKRVALMTTFYEATSGYSLIGVAETQLHMLLDHGYSPIVLVQDEYYKDQDGNEHTIPFKEQPLPSLWNSQTLDLRPVIPPMALVDDLHPDFEARVERIAAALADNLADAEVCITHDIILQNSFKEHNVAVRRYSASRPDLLWLHWIHSRPSGGEPVGYPENCRHTPPPGYIVYPNGVDVGRVASAYNLGPAQWRVKVCRAAHSIDPLLLTEYQGLTKDIVRASDLLGGEVVCVYPVRLDRGKQVQKIIRLLAGIQRAGLDVRLVVCDWQSQGGDKVVYRDDLKRLVGELKLTGKVYFTSDLDDRSVQGVPRRVVLELLDLSNIYIHPSRVETYSLTTHEAALRGNLLVLNYDLAPARELFGNHAVYVDFDADGVDRSYRPDEQGFFDDEALRVVTELRQNRALWARTRARLDWSPARLWPEFEPLLYLQPIAGEGQWTSS